jgi:hypothetical protein
MTITVCWMLFQRCLLICGSYKNKYTIAQQKRAPEPRLLQTPPPRGTRNSTWPTPLSGRGPGTAFVYSRTLRFKLAVCLEAVGRSRVISNYCLGRTAAGIWYSPLCRATLIHPQFVRVGLSISVENHSPFFKPPALNRPHNMPVFPDENLAATR